MNREWHSVFFQMEPKDVLLAHSQEHDKSLALVLEFALRGGNHIHMVASLTQLDQGSHLNAQGPDARQDLQ